MNILHAVHRYYPWVGGSERVVREMSEGMAALGHHVMVLTRGRCVSEMNGVEVRSTRHYRRDLDILTRGADILMVFGQKVWCSDWLPLSRIHCPLVYIPVGFDAFGKNLRHRLYYRFWQARVCRMADALVALTRSEETFLRAWIDHPRMTRIPVGVDIAYWRRPFRGRLPTDFPQGPFLFCPGGYYPNKNIEELVRQVFFLKEEGVLIDLVVCGPDVGGGLGRAKAVARELGVEVQVQLRREVDPELLKALYQRSSVVVSASTFEGFGLSFLEGLACGKPVVANPVGVIPELAHQTPNVWAASSHEEFSLGVRQFLENGHDPEESRATATEYALDRVIGEFEHLYATLADGGVGEPHYRTFVTEAR